MRIKTLVGLILFILLIPQTAKAVDLLPQYNPVCWKLEDCENTRAKVTGISDSNQIKQLITNKEGWVQDDECTGDWGKCLPAGVTKTEIAFGGKTSFANIGEFIKYNYNLALSIAGILAVIMIIVAGVQWTASGGNSEMISSAKKRISGALIGLLIAYLSYTILNTINPATINLRLPQAWMIRPQFVVADYCDQMPIKKDNSGNETKLIWAKPGVTSSPTEVPNDPTLWSYQSKTWCGSNYWVPDVAGQTCKGNSCEIAPGCKSGETPCLCITVGDKKEDKCVFAEIGGKVTPANSDSDMTVHNVWLNAYCADGSVKALDSLASLPGWIYSPIINSYGFSKVNDQGTSACGGADKVKGFFFIIETAPSPTYLASIFGINAGPSVSLGHQPQWLGGKSLCKENSCSWIGADRINTSDAKNFFSTISSSKLDSFLQDQLFTTDDIKGGFKCNFNITIANFPAVPNATAFGIRYSYSKDKTVVDPCNVLTKYLDN